MPASASKCQQVPASASKCQQVPASASKWSHDIILCSFLVLRHLVALGGTWWHLVALATTCYHLVDLSKAK